MSQAHLETDPIRSEERGNHEIGDILQPHILILLLASPRTLPIGQESSFILMAYLAPS